MDESLSHPPNAPMEWVRHAEFLRRLARRLAKDGHEADDLTQETWLRAMENPPRHGKNPRGWLGRVLQNVARQTRRRASVRHPGQGSARASEVAPSSGELAEQLELHRKVAQAVFELPEPYQTTLHQRYYLDLSAGQIARNAGLPVETVRTRLKRSLALLRARLDRDFHGDRQRWLAALAPVGSVQVPAKPLALGVLMSTQAKVGIAAAVAVLLAGGVFLGRGDAVAPTPAPETVLAPLTSAGVAAAEEAVRPTARADQASQRDETRQHVETEQVRVFGKLIVTIKGQEREDMSGSFVLTSERPGEPVKRTPVKVRKGKFEVLLDPEAKPGIHELTVKGSPAHLTEKPRRVGDELTVRATLGSRTKETKPRGPGMLLHVLDAASGQPLTGVTILERTGLWRDNEHPGDLPSQRIAELAASPVEIPGQGNRQLWVHATGFAWRRVQLDASSGGERTIELEPGGTLQVTTYGDVPPPDAWVRVRRSTSGVFQYVVEKELLVNTPTRIDDLLPGEYEVLVQTGVEDGACTYGEAPAEVVANDDRFVEVEVDRALVPELVPLSGRITLPEAWDGEDLLLRLRRDRDYTEALGQEEIVLSGAEMDRVLGPPTALHWDAGEVMPGWYIATVPQVQTGIRFEVPEKTPHHVDLAIPDVLLIAVRFRDAASGEAVTPDWFGYCAGQFEGTTGNRNQVEAAERLSDGWAIRAVPGEIGVTVRTEGYENLDRVAVEIAPDTEVLSIDLSPVLGLQISLEHAGATVPADYGFWRGVEIVPPAGLDPDGVRNSGRRAGGFWQLYYLEGPGEYTVRLPALAGYRAPEPLRVTIDTGGIHEAVVELTPENP